MSENIEKNDEELALETQKGNISAFSELVKRYQERIWLLAYQWAGNKEDAKDIVQNSFVKAFRAIKKYKPNIKSESGKGRFLNWLYRITINTAIDYQRHKKRRPQVSFEDYMISSSPSKLPVSSISNPAKEILNKELAERINKAVDTLPVRQKEVFVLRNFHGLSMKEIGDILKCSEGTVKVNLYYAVRALRDKLKDYVQGER
jgi:RNA polymerase sigma-70 factor (ECF subfamily)